MPPLEKPIVGDGKVPNYMNLHQVHVKPRPLTSSSRSNCIHDNSSNHSSSSSSSSTASISSNHSSATCHHRSTASLTSFHAVKCSLRAIVLFLQNHGVAQAKIQELIQLIQQKQFLLAMARAEAYVEQHRLVQALRSEDTDALTLLFTAAWTALVDHGRSTYQRARNEYARHENMQWQEFIGQQGLGKAEQEQRRRRHALKWNPTERQLLVHNLNLATRAKMDAEKGFALNHEWTRNIRLQQQQRRRIHATKRKPATVNNTQ